MTLLNIPDQYIASRSDDKITYDFNLTIFTMQDKVRFDIGGVSTSWLASDDGFIKRIQFERLNKSRLKEHLAKEIEIKNVLDEGVRYLKKEKYPKAITCFDEVICYDDNHAEALLFKSRALFGQGHFIKALRFYKKALKANAYLKDIEYHGMLVKKANDERDSFPKIKMHIYRGDEHFRAGNFAMAIESYDKALEDPSKFKTKILNKLLNKKGTALFELRVFDRALDCFEKSFEIQKNDYAAFMAGYCRYMLGLDLNDSFMQDLKLTKYQKLCKSLILIEVNMYDDAIKCLDDLLSVHFVDDKLHFMAVESKIKAMNLLDV